MTLGPGAVNGAGAMLLSTTGTLRHAKLAFLWLVLAASTLVPAGTTRAAFPGVNGKIIFVGQESWDYDIYSVNVDGSELTNLTNNSSDVDLYPQWSPDGERIAYETHREGYGDYRIAVMDADGGNKVLLGSSAARMPAWSPDGAKIAYWKYINEIQVVDLATGQESSPLTGPSAANDYDPAWSPDGTKIAFTSDRDGNNEVYVMNADGTQETRLTEDIGPNMWPSWHPDGSRILFGGNTQIMVMNADGTGQAPLASGSSAAWSPDGTKVVLDGLRIIELDGTLVTTVPIGITISNPAYPDWQPVPDSDLDGIPDETDNCPEASNPTQNDKDGDGAGNACDADDDNDGVVDSNDLCPLAPGERDHNGCQPSSVMLSIAKRAFTIRAKGRIVPTHSGVAVRVTLVRKRHGHFRTVVSRSPLLDASGRFSLNLKRPRPGTCRIRAVFPRDADHESSRSRVTFRC